VGTLGGSGADWARRTFASRRPCGWRLSLSWEREEEARIASILAGEHLVSINGKHPKQELCGMSPRHWVGFEKSQTGRRWEADVNQNSLCPFSFVSKGAGLAKVFISMLLAILWTTTGSRPSVRVSFVARRSRSRGQKSRAWRLPGAARPRPLAEGSE